jgi:mannose-6-phosphate isomerase-like protein (cupin superfamily)
MAEVGWRVARLRDVPASSQRPGFSGDEYEQAMQERAPHILERWADARARFAHEHRRTHDIRGFLGIESFGVNAYEALAAGELLFPEHDETESLTGAQRHQELYVVLRGRARFTIDAEEVEGSIGTLVFVENPAARRKAVATESNTVVLALGGPVGEAYRPAPWEAIFRARYDAALR